MKRVKSFLAFILKPILFLAGLIALVFLLNDIMIFKYEDGMIPMHTYYDLPADTVDVLFAGSSHIGMNINTQLLYEEYGIAGYKCWGSIQPIWNTYYYLVEALKTQTPKVVVIDAHGATFDYEYSDYVVQTKNLLGLKFSRNKIDAVKASCPEDSWFNLLAGLPTYHSRYGELNHTDFEFFPWNKHPEFRTLSSYNNESVYSFSIISPTASEGKELLSEKQEYYLRKIIDLCNEKEIPLELVVCPYQLSQDEQRKFRTIADIADEYPTVHFTNYNDNYQDYGINPKKDYLDPGHFNKYGLPKYVTAIGELLSKYDLPDRRKDPNHIWNYVTKKLVPAYTMETQFKGDGIQQYVDTGVKLFETPMDSWTLITEFAVPPVDDENTIILSCFDESPDAYSGLLVNLDNNNRLSIKFVGSEDFILDEEMKTGQIVRLALVKDHLDVSCYLNGKFFRKRTLQTHITYDGDLLIGAQQREDGEIIRFSRPTVYDLDYYDYPLSEQEVLGWKPSVLPEPEEEVVQKAEDLPEGMLYHLSTTFRGDGVEKYVKTGLRLYEDPEDSWTLLSRIDPNKESGESVYYSCFRENPQHYTGLLVRRLDDGSLNILYGNGTGITIPAPTKEPYNLAIAKDRHAYAIYLDGECVMDWTAAESDPYEEELLIGCQVKENGEYFRYSGTTVYNLDVVEGVMDPEQIAEWKPAVLPEAVKEQGSSTDYTLAESFAGNGKDRYLDTGIRLYDVSDKDWSMHYVIDLTYDTMGTVAACFAEDPNNYRGFAFRQMDEDTYGVILGSAYVSFKSNPGRTMVVDIVKEEFTYRVYVDGALIDETEGRCSVYNGSLLLCAEQMENGSLFRFSNQKIRKLAIVAEALSDEQLKERYGADTKYR